MKKFLRILSLILSLVFLLLIFASCDNGDSSTDDISTTTSATTSVTTEPNSDVSDPSETEKEYIRDFNGRTFTVLGRDGSNTAIGKNFEISREAGSEDRVGQAVWERNKKLKNDYNLEVAQELVPNVSLAVHADAVAENSRYDVVIYQPSYAIQHANEAYLIDLYDLEPLDLSHKAFSERINEQLTVGGRLFATTSAFLLQDKSAMNILYYNADLAASAVSFDIAQAVANNTWNAESFYKAMRDAEQSDANKNALVANSFASTGAFVHGMGFDTYTRSEFGIEILYSLGAEELDFFDGITAHLFDDSLSDIPSGVIGSDGNANRDAFCAGNSLFYAGVVHDLYSGSISNASEFDLGVLPFPKKDAQQKEYRNLSYGDTSVFAVPFSAAEPYDSAFFLQVISEYSIDTTYRAYLDTCQAKLTNAQSFDMLKLCLDSLHYDIVSVVNPKNFYLSFLKSFHEGTPIDYWEKHSIDGQAYLGQLEVTFSEIKKYEPED